ncbi:DUF4388 domain-containing protein [Kallotenue papyrolyticum]|uniref:DUF4388 domain-containing protein n=1 Tax=Kallotenue papyrolyticum TaxID=1325125 RepID=UPI0004785D86|nr:DUF4388 domain-containing protein [Kallotenue papyrolyticum]
MQLEGNLARVPLRELLELCAASLVTGMLEVDTPAGRTHLFFVEGTCVHASAPGATGFEAIWPLFELREADFRFVAGAQAPERSVVEPLPEVIARAEGLAQRWARLRPHIPHLDLVPTFVVPAGGEQVRIYEEDWPVLSCVDGARTIAEIAQRAMLDPCEVCEALLRLRQRGLIQLEERLAPAIQTTAPLERPPASLAQDAPSMLRERDERAGFFARLLAELPVAPRAELPAAPTPQPQAPPSAPAEQLSPDDILRLLRT